MKIFVDLTRLELPDLPLQEAYKRGQDRWRTVVKMMSDGEFTNALADLKSQFDAKNSEKIICDGWLKPCRPTDL
jgi:hypothetical protein